MEANESTGSTDHLTSTVVESVQANNGHEKKTNQNDPLSCGDSTPSSSSDANMQSSIVKTIQDDPISSTSDSITNINEGNLTTDTNSTDGNVGIEPSGSSTHELVADTDYFTSELNMESITTEKISEDVEDIANDLENLLGGTTQGYGTICLNSDAIGKNNDNKKDIDISNVENFDNFLDQHVNKDNHILHDINEGNSAETAQDSNEQSQISYSLQKTDNLVDNINVNERLCEENVNDNKISDLISDTKSIEVNEAIVKTDLCLTSQTLETSENQAESSESNKPGNLIGSVEDMSELKASNVIASNKNESASEIIEAVESAEDITLEKIEEKDNLNVLVAESVAENETAETIADEKTNKIEEKSGAEETNSSTDSECIETIEDSSPVEEIKACDIENSENKNIVTEDTGKNVDRSIETSSNLNMEIIERPIANLSNTNIDDVIEEKGTNITGETKLSLAKTNEIVEDSIQNIAETVENVKNIENTKILEENTISTNLNELPDSNPSTIESIESKSPISISSPSLEEKSPIIECPSIVQVKSAIIEAESSIIECHSSVEIKSPIIEAPESQTDIQSIPDPNTEEDGVVLAIVDTEMTEILNEDTSFDNPKIHEKTAEETKDERVSLIIDTEMAEVENEDINVDKPKIEKEDQHIKEKEGVSSIIDTEIADTTNEDAHFGKPEIEKKEDEETKEEEGLSEGFDIDMTDKITEEQRTKEKVSSVIDTEMTEKVNEDADSDNPRVEEKEDQETKEKGVDEHAKEEEEVSSIIDAQITETNEHADFGKPKIEEKDDQETHEDEGVSEIIELTQKTNEDANFDKPNIEKNEEQITKEEGVSSIIDTVMIENAKKDTILHISQIEDIEDQETKEEEEAVPPIDTEMVQILNEDTNFDKSKIEEKAHQETMEDESVSPIIDTEITERVNDTNFDKAKIEEKKDHETKEDEGVSSIIHTETIEKENEQPKTDQEEHQETQPEGTASIIDTEMTEKANEVIHVDKSKIEQENQETKKEEEAVLSIIDTKIAVEANEQQDTEQEEHRETQQEAASIIDTEIAVEANEQQDTEQEEHRETQQEAASIIDTEMTEETNEDTVFNEPKLEHEEQQQTKQEKISESFPCFDSDLVPSLTEKVDNTGSNMKSLENDVTVDNVPTVSSIDTVMTRFDEARVDQEQEINQEMSEFIPYFGSDRVSNVEKQVNDTSKYFPDNSPKENIGDIQEIQEATSDETIDNQAETSTSSEPVGTKIEIISSKVESITSITDMQTPLDNTECQPVPDIIKNVESTNEAMDTTTLESLESNNETMVTDTTTTGSIESNNKTVDINATALETLESNNEAVNTDITTAQRLESNNEAIDINTTAIENLESSNEAVDTNTTTAESSEPISETIDTNTTAIDDLESTVEATETDIAFIENVISNNKAMDTNTTTTETLESNNKAVDINATALETLESHNEAVNTSITTAERLESNNEAIDINTTAIENLESSNEAVDKNTTTAESSEPISETIDTNTTAIDDLESTVEGMETDIAFIENLISNNIPIDTNTTTIECLDSNTEVTDTDTTTTVVAEDPEKCDAESSINETVTEDVVEQIDAIEVDKQASQIGITDPIGDLKEPVAEKDEQINDPKLSVAIRDDDTNTESEMIHPVTVNENLEQIQKDIPISSTQILETNLENTLECPVELQESQAAAILESQVKQDDAIDTQTSEGISITLQENICEIKEPENINTENLTQNPMETDEILISSSGESSQNNDNTATKEVYDENIEEEVSNTQKCASESIETMEVINQNIQEEISDTPKDASESIEFEEVLDQNIRDGISDIPKDSSEAIAAKDVSLPQENVSGDSHADVESTVKDEVEVSIELKETEFDDKVDSIKQVRELPMPQQPAQDHTQEMVAEPEEPLELAIDAVVVSSTVIETEVQNTTDDSSKLDLQEVVDDTEITRESDVLNPNEMEIKELVSTEGRTEINIPEETPVEKIEMIVNESETQEDDEQSIAVANLMKSTGISYEEEFVQEIQNEDVVTDYNELENEVQYSDSNQSAIDKEVDTTDANLLQISPNDNEVINEHIQNVDNLDQTNIHSSTLSLEVQKDEITFQDIEREKEMKEIKETNDAIASISTIDDSHLDTMYSQPVVDLMLQDMDDQLQNVIFEPKTDDVVDMPNINEVNTNLNTDDIISQIAEPENQDVVQFEQEVKLQEPLSESRDLNDVIAREIESLLELQKQNLVSDVPENKVQVDDSCLQKVEDEISSNEAEFQGVSQDFPVENTRRVEEKKLEIGAVSSVELLKSKASIGEVSSSTFAELPSSTTTEGDSRISSTESAELPTINKLETPLVIQVGTSNADVEKPQSVSEDIPTSKYISKMSENEDLKMTITKHKIDSSVKVTDSSETDDSILKIYDPIDPTSDNKKLSKVKEAVVRKIIIKRSPLSPSTSVKHVEDTVTEQIVPKLLIKNMSPNRPSSPKIVKTQKSELTSPLKITIKNVIKNDDDCPSPSGPKVTIKPIPKPQEEEKCHSPKITNKIKSDDGPSELVHSPRHKSTSKDQKAKPDDIIKEKKESSTKITIKSIVKPENDLENIELIDFEDQIKQERIVLKINKNSMSKDSRKRESTEDIEKLAKIKLKLSKEGGHAHIVSEQSKLKRALEESADLDQKRPKFENDLTITPIEADVKKPEKVTEIVKNDVHITPIDNITASKAASMEDPLEKIPVFEITPETAMVMKSTASAPVAQQVVTPTPRKRGRPRKVPLVVREEFNDVVKEEVQQEQSTSEDTGRPKRSCRGPSVRTTLGIRTRKPRGAGRGRGRGRGRGLGSRGGRQQRLSAAKLKLLKEEASAAIAEHSKRFDDHVEDGDVDMKLDSTINNVATGSTDIALLEEETRMSADINNSRAQTPAKQIPTLGDVDDTQSSVHSTATTESTKARRNRVEVHPEPEGEVISADQLTEYYWGGGGPYMLQEQVAQFLGIKSFKRKYPGIQRRMVDMQERDFIRESGLVSEAMCDLGLTAVHSADILDIMYSDFQPKYEEYCKHQRDRQAKDFSNKQKALSLAASQEKTKQDITQQAVQSAASWNANFNKSRKDERKACMDLQTFTIHYPKGRFKPVENSNAGSYPVALVPGQFSDYYKPLNAHELSTLPMNTVLDKPLNLPVDDDSQSESGSDTSSSSSDSDSSSSSSSDEDCNMCSPTSSNQSKKVLAS